VRNGLIAMMSPCHLVLQVNTFILVVHKTSLDVCRSYGYIGDAHWAKQIWPQCWIANTARPVVKVR